MKDKILEKMKKIWIEHSKRDINDFVSYNEKIIQIIDKNKLNIDDYINNFYHNCVYCHNSVIHALRHGKRGNEAWSVMCLPHRVMDRLSKNAYNPNNVDYRNPVNADDYACETQLANVRLDIPTFYKQQMIAQGKSIVVSYTLKYSDLFDLYDHEITIYLYPVVTASIEHGEYENRSFAVIFAVEDINSEWGILTTNIHHFLKYVGYGSFRGLIDTCTFGDAIEQPFPKPPEMFQQRNSCKKCIIK